MRYTTTGNSRPHIVQDGYRNTPRVAGPLEREVKSIRFDLIVLPIALAAVWVVMGLAA